MLVVRSGEPSLYNYLRNPIYSASRPEIGFNSAAYGLNALRSSLRSASGRPFSFTKFIIRLNPLNPWLKMTFDLSALIRGRCNYSCSFFLIRQ
ncbi:MAG: hypothetical protein AUJ47_09250 [Candidatus Marinimicrobia bacterium CG1_02_48_14]|nr:MAG: hypothetical protein AUJ47_09250 [Candidatus Marinimicrobia bacterium CG1_02_48_14]